MPSTVNGVGTHYYGRRNVLARPGICPHCGRSVNLVSYDTRLWFVILFIPVVPLGRKRIIDRCPSCSRHYVASLQKWETAKQLEISGALEKFRSNPSPETAIEAHRQLLVFHQLAEAAELQKAMCAQFPDNARVHVYLAAALTQFGRTAEAEPLYSRALELRPDLPEARIGVAGAYIRAGRLDEARRLLDFMEKPGASQLYALAPLERLALAYQKAGRHEGALDLFARLLQELPAVAQHKGFRAAVKKSETALRRRDSILPRARFSLRRLFQRGTSGGSAAPRRTVSPRTFLLVLGAGVLLAAVGLALSNEYIRRHRTLYVVNAAGPGQKLEISGVGPVQLVSGLNEVSLAEGGYQAHFTGPVREDVGLDIHTGYFGRWTDKSAWVLNPGGAAIIVFERAVYSRTPPPPAFTYRFGRRFEHFPEVTHPFTPLPPSITVDASEGQKVLTSLDLFHGKPINALYVLEEDHRLDEAMSLAEWDLAREPGNEVMLRAYLEAPADTNQLPRIESFLRTGLTNRPVNIEWHRTYQQVCLALSKKNDLPGQYEDMLAKDPDNSALLYLLGRICDDRARASALFARSHQADDTNPYPIYAMAYDQIARGDWPGAMPLMDRVVVLRPDDQDFRDVWVSVCLALGQFDRVETEMRGRLRRDPIAWQATLHLCDTLALQGKRAEMDKAVADLMREIKSRAPGSANDVYALVENHCLYAVGDFTALEKAGRAAGRTPAGQHALFTALVEQSRLDEAGGIYPAGEVKDPVLQLGMILALQSAGQTNEVLRWQTILLYSLHSGNADSRRAADQLEGKTAPTEEALNDLALAPQFKAALLACLAATHPESRDRLDAAARRLNVEPTFPYHLIRRVAAGTP